MFENTFDIYGYTSSGHGVTHEGSVAITGELDQHAARDRALERARGVHAAQRHSYVRVFGPTDASERTEDDVVWDSRTDS